MRFREDGHFQKREFNPGMETRYETISTAALKYREKIFTGVNHLLALTEAQKEHPGLEFSEVQNGFLTSQGRFVDRDEADLIAKLSGQIKRSWRGHLHSEELGRRREH